MPESDELTETLRQAQRFGFFGAAPIEDAISHARQFVAAIGEVRRGTTLLDLGSGGGLPGLVLAGALPQARMVLLDRRQKRTDFLERAVIRLGFEHVDVWCDDAQRIAESVRRRELEPFDLITARGFGPPESTLRLAVGCLGTPVPRTGSIVISEPPVGDRWPVELLDELDLRSERVGAVRRFTPRSTS
jgi:16S rRNA (guanine527-N7)-methyltransferase